MIFAAGVGSRLKPFTDSHPKALVEINGQPMLGIIINRMLKCGINRIIINVHHFSEQIIAYINTYFQGYNILISDESNHLLDTGGGVAYASHLFIPDEPIMLHNADILTDFALTDFINHYKNEPCDALLAVATRDSTRQLYFDCCGHLRGWQNLTNGDTKPAGFTPTQMLTPLAFSGIQIISPRTVAKIRDYATSENVFSITPFYLENINDLDIRGYKMPPQTTWFDVGRPKNLEEARKWVNRI